MSSQFVLSEGRGKLVGIIGYILLSLAILSAHFSPTQGYELSIYNSTPGTIWLLLLSSFVIGVVLVFFTTSPVRKFGPLLTAFVAIVVSSLPVMRGYVLLGQFDLLNHAGTVVEILNYQQLLSPIMYPAMHTIGASISIVTGLSGYHSLSLLVGVFVALFIAGGNMLMRGFSSDWWTRSLGTLLACLLLPVISIRLPKLQSIPAVFALFYCVFLLGVLSRHNQSKSDTGWRVLYIVVGPALVLFHPQFALVAIGTGVVLILGLQVMGRWFPHDSLIKRRAFGFTLITGVVFAEWVSQLPGFRGALANVIVETSSGGSSLPDPSSELQAVGGSTLEIIFKVFGIKILISIVAAGIGISLIRKTINETREYSETLYYVTAAGVATAPLIGLFFLILGETAQGFRYIGFAFGLASLVAAAGGSYILKIDVNKTLVRSGLAFAVVIAALGSAPVMFNSPYVYQPNEQVTSGQLAGYETLYEHRGNGQVTAIATSPYRARNALFGKAAAERGINMSSNSEVVYQYGDPSRPSTTSVPPHFSNQTFHRNNSNVYLVTTSLGRSRYLELYDGFRYNTSDFNYLNRRSSRVYSNGDMRVYYFI